MEREVGRQFCGRAKSARHWGILFCAHHHDEPLSGANEWVISSRLVIGYLNVLQKYSED